MSAAETTHPLSWLSAICTPDRPRREDICAHPWLVEWGGRAQVVATDARLLVAVADVVSGHGFPRASQELQQTLLGVLDRPLSPTLGRAAAIALAAWCGSYDPGQKEPCDSCGGDGRCECPRCDGDHDCGVCGGSGQQGPIAPCRPGRLFGKRVDRNILVKAVSNLDGSCAVHADKDFLALVGAGWLVWLAPMTDEGKEEGEPEFRLSHAGV